MRASSRPIFAALPLVLAAAASGQCTSSWSILLGSIPPARQNATMAYDAARGRVTMFGGLDSLQFNVLGDTWVLSGENWTQTALTGSAPSARFGAAMVYDSARQRIGLFGGGTGSGSRGTWEG